MSKDDLTGNIVYLLTMAKMVESAKGTPIDEVYFHSFLYSDQYLQKPTQKIHNFYPTYPNQLEENFGFKLKERDLDFFKENGFRVMSPSLHKDLQVLVEQGYLQREKDDPRYFRMTEKGESGIGEMGLLASLYGDAIRAERKSGATSD